MKIFTFFVLISTLPLCATTRYVSLDGGHIPPFTDGWASAATNIQDAIDVALTNDIILVSNGVYRTGGRPYSSGVTNRVVVPFALTVRSLNGAKNTFIEGDGPVGDSAIRCVYLANKAVLDGFTLTNGFTSLWGSQINYSGGGVYSDSESGAAVITNCIFTRCTASWGGGVYRGTVYNSIFTHNNATIGGGAYSATLYNCLIKHNSASQGGGVHVSTLHNCTVVRNTASSHGGGVRDSTAYNSIVYFNTAGTGPDHWGFASHYSCTTPGAYLTGSHTITNNPVFIDNETDFHLHTTSPCINTGTNLPWMIGATDLDGNDRIFGGRVDMGCYEFIPEPASAMALLLCAVVFLRLISGTR